MSFPEVSPRGAGRATVASCPLPSHSDTGRSRSGPGPPFRSHRPGPDPGDLLQHPPVLDPSPAATPQVYLIVLRPSKGGAPREVRGPPSHRQGRSRAHTWRKKSGRGRGLPNRSPLPPQMAQTWPGTQLRRERGLTQPSPARAPAPPTLSWLLFQVVVEAPASSAELHNLTSSTEYLVSVLPVYKAGVGEGLQGPVTTGGRGGTWAQGCKGCPCLQPPLGAWHRGSLNPGGAHPQPVTRPSHWASLTLCPLLSTVVSFVSSPRSWLGPSTAAACTLGAPAPSSPQAPRACVSRPPAALLRYTLRPSHLQCTSR